MKTHPTFLSAEVKFKNKKYNEALLILNELITHAPTARTFALLGDVLNAMNLKEEAVEAYKLAAERTQPANPVYLQQALDLYVALKQEDHALLIALRLYNADTRNLAAAYVLCRIYRQREEYDLARAFAPALSRSTLPQHVEMAYMSLGWDVKNQTEKHVIANLFRKYPNNSIFRLMHLHFSHEDCDFEATSPIVDAFGALPRPSQRLMIAHDNPFHTLHWSTDEELLKYSGSNVFRRHLLKPTKKPFSNHRWSDKIRIGYVSSDFYDSHATMKLVKQVFELHDNTRFDISYFCHTKRDNIPLSELTLDSIGRVIRIDEMSDDEAALTIQEADIDILVDLKGRTGNSRVSIFERPCAPVLVSWLGFPGTTVNSNHDYIIGDPYVLPDHSAPYFWEAFCRLPETYQPNAAVSRPFPRQTTRASLGLPDDKFVFASFNAPRKISPRLFDRWVNILKRAPESIFWMMVASAEQQKNFTKYFKRAGIPKNRILFTLAATYDLHICRLSAADLALDTYPVNGHTTTSEKLWAGLPVLTIKGSHFASRVSESLLNAIGLEGLVTEDLQAYEERAVELYQNPDEIKAYKEQLNHNRFIKPLFDAERFTRHLETAYQMMADRAQNGLEPTLIDVPALPPRTEPFMTR